MKIATCVDWDGMLIGLHEQGRVQLFDYQSNLWVKVNEVPLTLNSTMSLVEVRRTLQTIVIQLDGCTSMVAGALKGAARAMLEDLGLAVFTSTGLALDTLDEVALATELASVSKPKSPEKPLPLPVPVNNEPEGTYQIDLQSVLNSGASHPSKTILIPFLEKRAFQKLNVICSHKPRWMDAELARLHLRAETTLRDNGREMLIAIYPDSTI